MQQNSLMKKYITEKEAANIYPFSISWFRRMRYQKDSGIPYIQPEKRGGKILYDAEELDKWIRGK